MRKTVNSRKIITSQIYTMIVEKFHYVIYRIGTKVNSHNNLKYLCSYISRPLLSRSRKICCQRKLDGDKQNRGTVEISTSTEIKGQANNENNGAEEHSIKSVMKYLF